MKPESLLLPLLLVGLLVLMFSRTRRQQREAQQLQSGLVVGARVMTTAGLYATVVGLADGVVVLETAPGQTSRWDRRAIAKVLPEVSSDEVGADESTGSGSASREVSEQSERTEQTEGSGGVAGSATPSQEAAPPDRA